MPIDKNGLDATVLDLPGRKREFLEPRTQTLHVKITSGDEAEILRRVAMAKAAGDRGANKATVAYILLKQQLGGSDQGDAVIRLSMRQALALADLKTEDPIIQEVIKLVQSTLTVLQG